MFAFLNLILLFILTGCASLPFPNWEGAVSKLDYDFAAMPFEAGGVKYKGTAVVDRKASQDITFYLPKDTIKLMITTCNREKFFAYPDFSKTFKYTYIPIMFLENRDSCFMTATAITKHGESYRAIVDFRSGETLEGELACNGEENDVMGVGFCQSRAGLTQRISFPVDVVAVAQEECAVLREVEPRSYEFKISPGFCAYRFMDKNKNKLRLTTFGYTQIKEVIEAK